MLQYLIPQQLLESKILVIDDDDWNCAYVYEVLAAYGFTQVRTMTDSSLVLDAIRREPPDLLLLDLYMPDPDGFEILAGLKTAVPVDSYLPVLIITSDEDAEVKQRALHLGATDFLPKPFEEIVVAARVANLLRMSRGQPVKAVAEVTASGGPLDSGNLRALLAKIPAGVVLVDNGGNISFANDEFCSLFSIRASGEELQDASWEEALTGLSEDFRDSEEFASGDRVIRDRAEAVDRQLLELKDGRVFERDYVPLTLEGGGRGHLWIFRNAVLANRVHSGAGS